MAVPEEVKTLTDDRILTIDSIKVNLLADIAALDQQIADAQQVVDEISSTRDGVLAAIAVVDDESAALVAWKQSIELQV